MIFQTSISAILLLVIQSATLLSVIIGFWSLIAAIRNARRQMSAQVFMKYTERYEHILGFVVRRDWNFAKSGKAAANSEVL